MKYVVLLILLSSYIIARKNKLRIIGGTTDTEIMFPWVVRLEIERNNTLQVVCTGSLLNPEIVLTAAHCSGEYISIQSNKTDKQYSKVLNIINHKFHMQMNDIALYKVATTVVRNYGMVSAADYSSLIGLEVYIMGFGNTVLFDENLGNFHHTLMLPNSLKYGPGVIHKCDDIRRDKKSFMCVFRSCNKIALANSGDSGGPVVLDGKIVGINSAVIPSFMQNTRLESLSLFTTPVSPYVKWLQKIIIN